MVHGGESHAETIPIFPIFSKIYARCLEKRSAPLQYADIEEITKHSMASVVGRTCACLIHVNDVKFRGRTPSSDMEEKENKKQ